MTSEGQVLVIEYASACAFADPDLDYYYDMGRSFYAYDSLELWARCVLRDALEAERRPEFRR